MAQKIERRRDAGAGNLQFFDNCSESDPAGAQGGESQY
jgi:hypothetical protein